jgi:hypothetical protein
MDLWIALTELNRKRNEALNGLASAIFTFVPMRNAYSGTGKIEQRRSLTDAPTRPMRLPRLH